MHLFLKIIHVKQTGLVSYQATYLNISEVGSALPSLPTSDHADLLSPHANVSCLLKRSSGHGQPEVSHGRNAKFPR